MILIILNKFFLLDSLIRENFIQSLISVSGTEGTDMETQTCPPPCVYRNDLIGAELQASVQTRRVLAQQDVHDSEKLFDSLVLSEVLPALYQKGVVPLVIPTNDETLGTTNRRHHLYLQARSQRTFTLTARTRTNRLTLPVLKCIPSHQSRLSLHDTLAVVWLSRHIVLRERKHSLISG